jgi:hypothetical protein
MSSTTTVSAIRIVSLPRELQTTYDVSDFIINATGVEKITSVNILSMNTSEGVPYRSAFIDVETWGDSESATTFVSNLLSSDGSGVIISAINGFADGGFTNNGFPNGIHYDNGKSMKYLKIVPTKTSHPSITTPLALSENAWTSIYIPVLPTDLTMDNGDVRFSDVREIENLFQENLKIGKVSRVDITTKTIPGSQREVRSAYVHFEQWHDNVATNTVRSRIDAVGDYKCYGFYDGFEFRRFDYEKYITFKVNHKPIPAADCDLNIHQLAAAKDFLDKRVAELEEQVKRLQEELSAYKDFAGGVEQIQTNM